MDKAAVIVGGKGEELAFSVQRLESDPGRTRWEYVISRPNGPVLHLGNDLYGPEGGDATGAVKLLLSFAHATVVSLQRGGTDPHGFSKDTVAAISTVVEDISLAMADGNRK